MLKKTLVICIEIKNSKPKPEPISIHPKKICSSSLLLTVSSAIEKVLPALLPTAGQKGEENREGGKPSWAKNRIGIKSRKRNRRIESIVSRCLGFVPSLKINNIDNKDAFAEQFCKARKARKIFSKFETFYYSHWCKIAAPFLYSSWVSWMDKIIALTHENKLLFLSQNCL